MPSVLTSKQVLSERIKQDLQPFDLRKPLLVLHGEQICDNNFARILGNEWWDDMILNYSMSSCLAHAIRFNPKRDIRSEFQLFTSHMLTTYMSPGGKRRYESVQMYFRQSPLNALVSTVIIHINEPCKHWLSAHIVGMKRILTCDMTAGFSVKTHPYIVVLDSLRWQHKDVVKCISDIFRSAALDWAMMEQMGKEVCQTIRRFGDLRVFYAKKIVEQEDGYNCGPFTAMYYDGLMMYSEHALEQLERLPLEEPKEGDEDVFSARTRPSQHFRKRIYHEILSLAHARLMLSDDLPISQKRKASEGGRKVKSKRVRLAGAKGVVTDLTEDSDDDDIRVLS